MLDISEVLDDPDFIQTVEFGIIARNGASETESKSSHANTNVQPASGTVLQRLPELERSKPTLQVFTKSSFPIKNGDYMYFNGKKWRCVTDEDWSQYGYYDGLFQLYSGAQVKPDDDLDPYA